jgi:hypothetical protein
MQRKLVSFDVFETIEKNSLFNALKELDEATGILGKALDIDLVSVHCYDGSSVVYECADGTFVKANYNFNDKEVKFTNIEELVVDAESETEARKVAIAEMVDALASNDTDSADLSWDKVKLMLERVMKRGRAKKSMVDKFDDNFKKMGKMQEAAGGVFVRRGAKNMGKSLAAKRGWGKRRHKEPGIRAKMSSKLDFYRSNRKRQSALGSKAKTLKKSGLSARAYFTRAPKAKVNEWASVLDNFYNYVGGIYLNESNVVHNEQGDVVSVVIPTRQVRNEGKVIQIKLDVLKADVKVLREAAHRVVNSPEFCKAVAQLKRLNNISDNDGLEECLGNIVGRFPSLIALSQTELAEAVSKALKFAGEVNFDDATCGFMSEGILRTAFESFPEKVEAILRLSETSKSDNEDSYLDFQSRIAGFYSKIDESIAKEVKLTADVYNAISDVAQMAESLQDNELKSEAGVILYELEPSLESGSINLNDVEIAAEWLVNFFESNLDSENGWGYVDNPEETANGETSKVRANSGFGYSPKSDLEAGTRSHEITPDSMKLDGEKIDQGSPGFGWQNFHSDIWPQTKNPYLPSSIKYVGPKGESDDVNSDAGMASKNVSGETWNDEESGLKNVYLPRNLIPGRPEMGSDHWSK